MGAITQQANVRTRRQALLDLAALSWLEAVHARVFSAPLWGTLARLCAVLLAAACWGQALPYLAFVPALWLAWWRARHRLEAVLLVALYHGVACRGLVHGAVKFFGLALPLAVAVVAGCALLVGLALGSVWVAPCKAQPWTRTWMRTGLLVLLSVAPPLGALVVPSTLSAAGVWFPKAGWLGLVAWTLVVTWMRRSIVGPSALMACAFVHVWVSPPDRAAPGMKSLETSVDASLQDPFEWSRLLWQRELSRRLMRAVPALNAEIVVVPEGLGGIWDAPMERMWQPLSYDLSTRGRATLVGVTLPVGRHYQSAVVVLGGDAAIYRQRAPMPWALWRPWADAGSYEAHWFGPGTVQVGSHSLGLLVCWEIGVAWSVLGSVASGADTLVGVANLAWLRETNATMAQAQMLQSWGALFGLPTVRAVNL